MSLQGFINKEFAVTQVTVNVQDVNDNKPYFIYPFEGEAVQKYTAGKINCKSNSLQTTFLEKVCRLFWIDFFYINWIISYAIFTAINSDLIDSFTNETSQKYYAALASNSPLNTAVTQIKAEDIDSGKFGRVSYNISGKKIYIIFTLKMLSIFY